MKALLYQDLIDSLKKYLFSFIFIIILAFLWIAYFIPNMNMDVKPLTIVNDSLSISINSKASAFSVYKKPVQKKDLIQRHSFEKILKEEKTPVVQTSTTSDMGQQENTIVSKVSQKDYLQKGDVKYPRRAINNGFEGTVVFNVVVSFDSKIINIEMVSSSGYSELDRNALKSIKQWKFKPFSDAKQKIFQVPIEFKLE